MHCLRSVLSLQLFFLLEGVERVAVDSGGLYLGDGSDD